MSGLFLSLDYVPSGFIIRSLYFSKALLAPRSPGWASFVDKVPTKAGEDTSFHKRG